MQEIEIIFKKNTHTQTLIMNVLHLEIVRLFSYSSIILVLILEQILYIFNQKIKVALYLKKSDIMFLFLFYFQI